MSEISIIISLPIILISIVLLPTWYQSWGLNNNIIFGAMAISRALDIVIDPFIGYYTLSLLQLNTYQLLNEYKKNHFVQYMYEKHMSKIDTIYTMYIIFGIIGLVSLYMCLSNILLSSLNLNVGIDGVPESIPSAHEIDTYSIIIGCFYIILIACNSIIYIVSHALGSITIARGEEIESTPHHTKLYNTNAASTFSISKNVSVNTDAAEVQIRNSNAYARYVPKSNKNFNKNLTNIALMRVLIVLFMYVLPALVPYFIQMDPSSLPFECDMDKCVVHEATLLEEQDIEIPAGFGLPCSYYTHYKSTVYNYLDIGSTSSTNNSNTSTLIPIYNASYWNITYSNISININSNTETDGFVFNNMSYFDPSALYIPTNCMSSDAYLISPYCSCINNCNSMCTNNSVLTGYSLAAVIAMCFSGCYMLYIVIQHKRRRRKETTMFNSSKVMDAEHRNPTPKPNLDTQSTTTHSQAPIPTPFRPLTPSQMKMNSDSEQNWASYYLLPRTCYDTISTTYLSILDNRVFTTSALCWICDINIPILYIGLVKYIIDVVLLTPTTIEGTSDIVSAIADMGWSGSGNGTHYVNSRSIYLGTHSDHVCRSVDLSNIVEASSGGSNSNSNSNSIPGVGLFDNPVYAVHNYISSSDYHDYYDKNWVCDSRSVASVVIFMYLIGLSVGVIMLRILLLLRVKNNSHVNVSVVEGEVDITPNSSAKMGIRQRTSSNQSDSSDHSSNSNNNNSNTSNSQSQLQSQASGLRITGVIRDKALATSAAHQSGKKKGFGKSVTSNSVSVSGSVLAYIYSGLGSISNRTKIEVQALSCGLSVCTICMMILNTIYFIYLYSDTSSTINSKIGWCAFLAMLCGIPVGCKLHLHFVNLFNDILPYDTFIQNVGYFNTTNGNGGNIDPEKGSSNRDNRHINELSKRVVPSMDVYQSRLPIYIMFLILIPKLSTIMSYWVILSGFYCLGYNKIDISLSTTNFWLSLYIISMVCGLTLILSGLSLCIQVYWYPLRYNKQREILHNYLNMFKYNVKPNHTNTHRYTRLYDPISGLPISMYRSGDDISMLYSDTIGHENNHGLGRDRVNSMSMDQDNHDRDRVDSIERFRSDTLVSMYSNGNFNNSNTNNPINAIISTITVILHFFDIFGIVSLLNESEHSKYYNAKDEIQVVQEYYTLDEWKVVHILDYFLYPQHFEFMMKCLNSDRPEYIFEYSNVNARNTFVYGCGVLGGALFGLYLYISIFKVDEMYLYQSYYMSVGNSGGYFVFPLLLLFAMGVGLSMMINSTSNYFLVDRLNYEHLPAVFNDKQGKNRVGSSDGNGGSGIDNKDDESDSDENTAIPVLDLLTQEVLQRMYCVRQYKSHMYYADFMNSDEEIAQFVVNCNAKQAKSGFESSNVLGFGFGTGTGNGTDSDKEEGNDLDPNPNVNQVLGGSELSVIKEGNSDSESESEWERSESESEPVSELSQMTFTDQEEGEHIPTPIPHTPRVPKPPSASTTSGRNRIQNPYSDHDSVLMHTRSLLNSIRFTIKGDNSEGDVDNSDSDSNSNHSVTRKHAYKQSRHHNNNAFQPQDDDIQQLMDQYLSNDEHKHNYVEDVTKGLLNSPVPFTQDRKEDLMSQMGFTNSIEKQTKALLQSEINWADEEEEESDEDEYEEVDSDDSDDSDNSGDLLESGRATNENTAKLLAQTYSVSEKNARKALKKEEKRAVKRALKKKMKMEAKILAKKAAKKAKNH